MKLLFDAKSDEAKKRESREGVRKRADEVDRALKDFEDTEDASQKLGERLRIRQTVQPVRYVKYRTPGSKWQIEHARVGDDYIFQAFPLKPPTVPWQDIISAMIVALSSIFPDTIEVTLKPPDTTFKVTFYTIRAEGITKIPGWQDACEVRANRVLSEINAWP